MTTPGIAGLSNKLRCRATTYNVLGGHYAYTSDDCALDDRSADTLERQAAEIERLRGALADIKSLPDLSKNPADDFDRGARAARLNAADIARAALTGEDHD